LSVGLAPYLRLQSTSGKVGSTVGIVGQGFDSASAVKFNGVKATKVVLSGTTYITATVPAGASTGNPATNTWKLEGGGSDVRDQGFPHGSSDRNHDRSRQRIERCWVGHRGYRGLQPYDEYVDQLDGRLHGTSTRRYVLRSHRHPVI
jgi:hypothetical protein